jgi:50S ribosomal protein L16 3-hydroxylase
MSPSLSSSLSFRTKYIIGGLSNNIQRRRRKNVSSSLVEQWETVTLPFDEKSSKKFFDEFWQKKPLLLRNAIPNFQCPLDANELAGLACEDEFSSRLMRVLIGKDGDEGDDSSSKKKKKKNNNNTSSINNNNNNKWTLEIGPFSEETLTNLPDNKPWSLVINELDAKIPSMNDIITDFFPQFPRWRISDIQASVSPEDGGVGAHSDNFDVFLIQAIGDKLWSVADNEKYWPDKDESFVPNQDVRILKEFIADDSFLLKPGDILYLPPKIAHYGLGKPIKKKECSVTLSLGFLAPMHEEMIWSYAQQESSKYKDVRWRDPWMTAAEEGKSGEIDKNAVSHAWDILKKAEPKCEKDVALWMGKHATAKRFGESIALFDEKGYLEEQLGKSDKKKEIDYKSWEEVGFLQRNDGVRFAFIDSVNDDSIEENVVLFFAGGMSWTMKTDEGKAIAYTLANSSELEFMGKLNEKESVELVSQLLNIEFVFYPNEDDDDCEFEDDDDNSEEH